ncbi:hypothetical protein Q8G81_32920, partial [Klebsiella pneumoniae]
PEEQRFDFVTRVRKAEPNEKPDITTNYPQRDAVLYALRHLTGTDLGPTSESWQKQFDIAPASPPPTTTPEKTIAPPKDTDRGP